MNENHVRYILDLEENENNILFDHLRLNALYWGLTSLDLMGKLHLKDKNQVYEFVNSCKNSDGGTKSILK